MAELVLEFEILLLLPPDYWICGHIFPQPPEYIIVLKKNTIVVHL